MTQNLLATGAPTTPPQPSASKHATSAPGTFVYGTPASHSGLAAQKPCALRLGDLGDFWKSLDKATKDYDNDMLTALKSNLDNLLIFAALLSAVNSAVLALSVPTLSADPAEETNRLLRLLIQGVENATSDVLGPPSFTPPSQAIRINQLFSVSLTCSMLAAFGALVGQQWIISYQRRPTSASEDKWRERHRRFLGAQRWHLELVLEHMLPTFLQISMAIFLVGMTSYLQSLSFLVARPNTILTWVAAAIFFLTIIFSTLDPHCPFKTPLSYGLTSTISLAAKQGGRLNPLSRRLKTKLSRQWIKLTQKPQEMMKKLYYEKWNDEVLEGHSIRSILSTSADATAVRDVALNIPLMTREEALGVIYEDNDALSRLYRFYEGETSRGGSDEAIYSAAICHLVLSAQKGDVDRSNRFLRNSETRIILSAAQGHLNSPSVPTSVLPSSIVTVGLACLLPSLVPPDDPLSQATVEHYRNFLLQPATSSPTPELQVATLAWLLLSPPHCTRTHTFASQPINVVYGVGPFTDASRVYRMFYQPPTSERYRISSGVLDSVACALDAHWTLSDVTRQLLSGVLEGLQDALHRKMLVQEVSRLEGVANSLHPHLRNGAEVEVGVAGAKLIHAIYAYRGIDRDVVFGKGHQDARVQLDQYGNQMQDDDEYRKWLEMYRRCGTIV